MKNILIFILLLVTSSKSDDINLSFFNNQQKEILKNILKENDNIFSLKKNNLSISDVYFEHIKKLENSESSDELLNNLFLKDVSFCKSLYKSNIFNLSKSKVPNSEKEIINFDLNIKSKYLDFLKHFSKKNKTILKYYSSIISSGGISPSSTKLILHYLTKEDLKNKNIRLIISIHFLLINNS